MDTFMGICVGFSLLLASFSFVVIAYSLIKKDK